MTPIETQFSACHLRHRRSSTKCEGRLRLTRPILLHRYSSFTITGDGHCDCAAAAALHPNNITINTATNITASSASRSPAPIHRRHAVLPQRPQSPSQVQGFVQD